jgi:hypothetical protein
MRTQQPYIALALPETAATKKKLWPFKEKKNENLNFRTREFNIYIWDIKLSPATSLAHLYFKLHSANSTSNSVIYSTVLHSLFYTHYWNLGLCRVSAALPSAFYQTLGQSPALGKELVYRVQDTRHSEALGKDGSRQRSVSGRLQLTSVSLCQGSAAGTRQSRFFAECHIAGTRQRECLPSVFCWHSANHICIFFYFGHQTFCGMFLHYVDLHVLFWNNYNSVFNS